LIHFCEIKGELRHYLIKDTYTQLEKIFSEMKFYKGIPKQGPIAKINDAVHSNHAEEYAITCYWKGWWIFALKSSNKINYYVMQPPDGVIELIAMQEV
jgi:hypothetical protein